MYGSINVAGGSGEKVKIDGVKVVNKMELTSYKGDNPLTIGRAGVAFPANTLFLEDFDILNGVNGVGKYVWKKAWKYTVNITQTTTSANPTKFKVSGSGNNVSFSDVGFIVGKSFTSDLGHTLEFLSSTSVRHTTPDGVVSDYTFTWDSTNATVSIPVSWTSVHTFTAQEALRAKEFLVDDSSTAYPDRTTGSDGYYYAQYYEFYDKPENIKKYIDIFGVIGSMVEGLDLASLMGFTDVAIDKFTKTSDSYVTNAVSHSLGKAPTMAIVMGDTSNAMGDYSTMFLAGMRGSGDDDGGYYLYCLYAARSADGIFSTKAQSTAKSSGWLSYFTKNTVKFNSGNSLHAYKAGVEYTLITMV